MSFKVSQLLHNCVIFIGYLSKSAQSTVAPRSSQLCARRAWRGPWKLVVGQSEMKHNFHSDLMPQALLMRWTPQWQDQWQLVESNLEVAAQEDLSIAIRDSKAIAVT